MTPAGSVTLAIVVVLFLIDAWHNWRIARAYSGMANSCTHRKVISPESKVALASFFPLCGFGTHGMHVVHVGVEVALAVTLVLTGASEFVDNLMIPLAFVLLGSVLLHWKQAQSAEQALEHFFRRDLSLVDKTFTSLVKEAANKPPPNG